MLNLKYVYELEKQFVKCKYSLRELIREMIKKGLNRMYQTNFKQLFPFELLTRILNQNLNENDYNKIMELLSILKKVFNQTIQEFIEKEQEQFESEHPEAIRNGSLEIQRQSFLGKIKVDFPRYRNAEFTSAIIKSKSRTFFFDVMMLSVILSNGLMTYESIKTFFGTFGIDFSNSEIARISKVANEFLQEEMTKSQPVVHDDQLVVFIDGQWFNYKRKIRSHDENGVVYYENEKSKRVRITAIGIDVTGKKRVLTHIYSDKEDSDAYNQLLHKLKFELGINNIELFVSDGTTALNNALLEYYPDAKRQRCFFHVLKDIRLMMPRSQRRKLEYRIKMIVRQESKEQALAYYNSIKDGIRLVNTRVFNTLEKVIEDTTRFYDLPKKL